MGEVIDRRFLLLQKYIKMRDTNGHEWAVDHLTQAEVDEIFNYIVSCHTVNNLNDDGSCRIPKSL